MGYPFFGGVYRARCTRVVDGDTVDLVVDLGFHIGLTGRFRLLGIDTPELHAADLAVRVKAQEAKAYVTRCIATSPDGSFWWLRLTDVQPDPDNFGRWLGVIWHQTGAVDGDIDLNIALINQGLAVPYRK